jgi:hypothetical protein
MDLADMQLKSCHKQMPELQGIIRDKLTKNLQTRTKNATGKFDPFTSAYTDACRLLGEPDPRFHANLQGSFRSADIVVNTDPDLQRHIHAVLAGTISTQGSGS